MATLSGNYGLTWNNGTTPTPVGIGVSSGLAAVTAQEYFVLLMLTDVLQVFIM